MQRRYQPTTVAESDLRARLLRVRFDLFPHDSNAGRDYLPNLPFAHEVLAVPNQTDIADRGPTKRYPPVQKCIYCGSTEFQRGTSRPLSEEHVVSEGLGGTLVLPAASCAACASLTCRIEGSVLRTLLWAPRRRLRIRGKRRKRDDSFPVVSFVGEKEILLHLPLERHPTLLVLIELGIPGLITGRPLGDSGISGVWIHQMADIDRLASDGLANFASPAIDTVKFCQLLAKIAHSFAVAEIGLGNFQPLLADFAVRSFPLREQYTDCYHLVGGDPKSYAPSEALHTLGWGVWQNGLEAYLIVCIRLFASLGAPSYVLVAGKLTCEAHHEAVRARAEALARRPDKTPA